MREKLIAKNAILNTIKTILGIVFPLITFPYVSRILGVEQLGLYNFSASFVSYFLLIAALGVSTYAVREGTQYRDSKQHITEFVSQVFSINLLATTLAYILLIIILIAVPRLEKYQMAILLLSAEMIFTTIGVSWVCNIYEDFLFITVRTILIQLISLAATFIFIRSVSDIYKYICIIVFANSGSNLLSFFYIRNHYCRFYFTLKTNWKRHLKPIMVIFSTTVAITIYVSADTTMLGFMTSDHVVGLYSTAVKIYTIIKTVLSALLMVLIPQFSLVLASDDRERANQLFSKVFHILTMVMMPVAVGLFFLSKDIVLIISGSAFAESAGPLMLLSIATVFSLYSYMYTQCILIPLKKEQIVFKATVISAICNIGLNLVLIPIWGMYAAAVTTIIAEFLTFIISWNEARKHVSLSEVFRNLCSVFLGCVGIGVICVYSGRIDHQLLRLAVSFIVSVAFYMLVMMITRNSAFTELKKMLKR